jgi:hypothetical protein
VLNPIGFIHQVPLEDAVVEATKLLDAREVRDVRFTIGSNAIGEPSIFFAILLTPYAVHSSRFAGVTERITTTLFDHLQPYNRWGLQSYFNFTSDRSHFRDPRFM